MSSGSLRSVRFHRFRRSRRGYFAFCFLIAAYGISLILPLLINDQALIVRHGGTYSFPVFRYHASAEFGSASEREPDYRELKKRFAAANNGDFVVLPPYPYSATESSFDQEGSPPYPPSTRHILGSDDRGRDVFARLAYGFNVSVTFGVLVLIVAQLFGILAGAALGYFGGKVDLAGQRLVEIWMALPLLYIVLILSSIVAPVYITGRSLLLQPAFWFLVFLVSAFDWMTITYYVRGEVYREKAKAYVQAAEAIGLSKPKILFRHILPNALSSVFSMMPFILIANIQALVALDFLGFGLPAPTPSWGELIGQGTGNFSDWWLICFPLGALFLTLLLFVFIGDAVREAFAPRQLSVIR